MTTTTLSYPKRLHQRHWRVASCRSNHNMWRLIVVLALVAVSSRTHALLTPQSRFAQQRLATTFSTTPQQSARGGNKENVLVLGRNNKVATRRNRCGWKRTALAASNENNNENDDDDMLDDKKNHDALSSSWAAKEYRQKLRDAERAIAKAEEARIRYEAVQRERNQKEKRQQQREREPQQQQRDREQSLSNSNNVARRSTRNDVSSDSFVSSPNEDDKWEDDQALLDEISIPGTTISKTDAGTLVMEWAAPGVDSKALFHGAFSAAWFSAIVPITLTGGASLLFTVPFWLAGGLVAQQAVVHPWVASRLTIGDHLWTMTRLYAGKTVQQQEGATDTLLGVRPHLAVVVNGAPQYELKLLDQQHQALTTTSIPVPNVSKDELVALANAINRHLDDIRKRNGGSETTPPFPPDMWLSDWEDSSSFQ